MDLMNCTECGSELGGRWGNRCHTCSPGRPKSGEDRECVQCGKTFYVAAWQLRDTVRSQGKFCSLDCKHESLRLNPVGTPRWARRLLHQYGITHEQYLKLEADQNGKCAICGGEPNGPGERLHVDHCHATGKVRGLLCGKCNTAIGLLGERVELFERITEYLK